MSREAIVEGLRDELAQSQEELARLEAALKHVSKVPDSEQLVVSTPSPTTPVKRGRGRPKGSKNRPKDVIIATKMQKGTGKRGRPKGSKNKPKVQPIPDVVLDDIQPPTVMTSDMPVVEMTPEPMDETSVSQPPEVSAITDMPMVETAPEPVVVDMPSDTSMADDFDAPVTSPLALPPIQTREALFDSVLPE